MSKMIEIYSDISGCSEYSLTSYSDLAKTTKTTTTGTYFATNPAIRNLDTGAISRTLNYVISSIHKPTDVYVVAKTNPQVLTAKSVSF
jgi:hypothetical protein